ncbi:hypothetical protein SAMN04487843_12959 [Methylobacterium sp. ap11]|uniref:hypothetical protein n=1 Tax=Methylobacterium sp. ap11 TaxID=1761799 RepID=UPI0008B0D95F|nr:hypothetical protein [Methylobacterium sp. ap11]SEP49184.1 hypothetical protein SAMN04487843_12959 [Methylobacterium sp. ap11]
MGGSKGLADVLRGLIELVPILAWLVVVLAAVTGIFLAGYAMVRVYQANTSGDGTAGNWIVAAIIGSAMTVSTVVIAHFSFYFAD